MSLRIKNYIRIAACIEYHWESSKVFLTCPMIFLFLICLALLSSLGVFFLTAAITSIMLAR